MPKIISPTRLKYEELYTSHTMCVAFITFWQRINYLKMEPERAILRKPRGPTLAKIYKSSKHTRKKVVSITTFRRRILSGMPPELAIVKAQKGDKKGKEPIPPC